MSTPLHTLLMLKSKIRRWRRVLGWRDAIRLVIAQQMGRRQIKVLLSALGVPVELRLNDADAQVMEKIWLHQEYRPPFDIAPEFIVDAGANIGLSALYFAHLFPKAEIIALEPEPANFQLLTKNCAGHPSIHPWRAALWGHSASLHVNDPGLSSWAFRVSETSEAEDKNKAENVSAVTIPQLLARFGWERIDLLKLDIEGAERELFTPECRAWLPKIGLIIIELHDRYLPGCSRAFYSELVRLPFSQELRGENVFVQPTSTT